jgi:transposase
MAMGETRRKFDRDFREGAVRLVGGRGSRSAGGPGSEVQRGTLNRWVNADKQRAAGNRALDEDERAELAHAAGER